MSRCELCHVVGRHLPGCPNDSQYRTQADINGAWCSECQTYRSTSVTCPKCADGLCASCMTEHKCGDEK